MGMGGRVFIHLFAKTSLKRDIDVLQIDKPSHATSMIGGDKGGVVCAITVFGSNVGFVSSQFESSTLSLYSIIYFDGQENI
jgi:hypothetical protein